MRSITILVHKCEYAEVESCTRRATGTYHTCGSVRWRRTVSIALLVWICCFGLVGGAWAKTWDLPSSHFLAAPLAEAEKVYAFREAARQASKDKQWLAAIENWDELLKLWPEDLEALTEKANVLSAQLNRREDAIAVRELAAKAVPWSAENRYQICELKFELKDFSGALEACETSIMLHRQVPAMARRADLLFLLGQQVEARAQYLEVVERLNTADEFNDLITQVKGLRLEHDHQVRSRESVLLEVAESWSSERLSQARAARSSIGLEFRQQLGPFWKSFEIEHPPEFLEMLRSLDARLAAAGEMDADSKDGFKLQLAIGRAWYFVQAPQSLKFSEELRGIESSLLERWGRGTPWAFVVGELKLVSTIVGSAEASRRQESAYELISIVAKTHGSYSHLGVRALNTASRAFQFGGNAEMRTAVLARALTIAWGLYGGSSEKVTELLMTVAVSLDHGGQVGLVEPLLRRYVAEFEANLGKTHDKVVAGKIELGSLLVQVENFAEAVKILEDVRTALSGSDERKARLLARVNYQLWLAYRALAPEPDVISFGPELDSDSGEVSRSVSSGAEYLEKISGLGDVDEAVALFNSNRSYEALEKFAEARRKLRAYLGDSHFLTLALGLKFSELALRSGRYNAALANAEEVHHIIEKAVHTPAWVKHDVFWYIGQATLALKRLDESYRAHASYWVEVSRDPVKTLDSSQALFNLSVLMEAQGHHAAAIFLAKKSVNGVQGSREGLISLQDGVQKDFLRKYSASYRFLAASLVERGRVIEAEQVLQMLKELELRELTPRSHVGAAVQFTRVDLGGREQRVQMHMDALLQEGATLQAESDRVQVRLKLSQGSETENRQRATELGAKLQAWETAMRAFLDNLPKELPEVQAAGGEQENEKAKGRLQAVVQRDPTAVGLQFVVTDERLGILLASREGTVGRFSPITRVELSQRVSQLRTAILNKADTREAAQALWKALLGPVEADLQRLGARTLLLASTDVLRYLPFAALQDEQGRYLIERFALANWLAAAPDPKPRTQTQPWRMAALGVTQAKPGFPALPGVRREIQGIVRSPINPGGALPGYAYLDDEFDLQHLDEAIGGAGNIVHVASHFDFRPGDERRSVLLVGRGDPVSMASLARRDFAEVEQLTLSACETATGGGFNETGAEVEGLAALLLVKQARSVMGTLWKVADASTAQLMVSYYRQMQSGGAGEAGPLSGRAAALRAAQLQLLKGQGASVADKSARGARPLAAGTPSPSAPSPDNPWAHPYYWAPFVISGDWM